MILILASCLTKLRFVKSHFNGRIHECFVGFKSNVKKWIHLIFFCKQIKLTDKDRMNKMIRLATFFFARDILGMFY